MVRECSCSCVDVIIVDGASWSIDVDTGELAKSTALGAAASGTGEVEIVGGLNTQNVFDEIGELRAISGYMLRAARVQIPENNLDSLHSSREEHGTSEIMDPQDLLGSFLLADISLIILGLGASVSRAVGFLRGTLVVMVILVKGHAFPTIVKV
nr:hypothetical protein [Tanacetum cinerariifolium]